MAYKALVLDMDGTLLCTGRKTLGEAVARALAALQRRGVSVILATGRGPVGCGPAVLSGFTPNYSVYNNGANVCGAGGQVIHEDRFTAEDMAAVLAFAEEHGFPLSFLFEDAYYAYNRFEQYRQRYCNTWGDDAHLRDGSDKTRHRQSMPFAAFVLASSQAVAEFGKRQTRLRMMRSSENAYDVCKRTVDKAGGLAVLLNNIGLGWQDVVAVGDGDNDIDMLHCAALGVAMANASDAARKAADTIAPDVRQDGVLWVIEQFFIH